MMMTIGTISPLAESGRKEQHACEEADHERFITGLGPEL
jgi:hypothetical protein